MNDASGHTAQDTRTRRNAVGARVFTLRPRTATWRFLAVALTSVALLIGAAVPAAAAELMRVTFVRHGESAGNVSGLIDTSTPGPVLTPKGQQQAQAVAGTLGDNNYDAIYGSTMVRTQLTAAPMSQYLRLPIQVLPGLQEIEAGVFEGTPESEAANGYAAFPLAWTFQGNRDLRIPGSINGHEFDARMDGALQSIYDNGDRNPVVFSHGGAIMFWTMMNVDNLTLAQKIDLLRTQPLDNTDYVIIEGNPHDGWTLVNWNGRLFSPEPTFAAELRRQVRTLTRQLSATVKQVFDAFATRDVATILTALNRGIADAVFSIAKFGRAVNAELIQGFDRAGSPAPSSNGADATSAATTPAAPTTAAPTTVAPADSAHGDSAATLSSADDGRQASRSREVEPIADAETEAVASPEPAGSPQPADAPESKAVDVDAKEEDGDQRDTSDDDVTDPDDETDDKAISDKNDRDAADKPADADTTSGAADSGSKGATDGSGSAGADDGDDHRDAA